MKICLIIGYPIKTSKSPAIHNAGYKKLKIDNGFIFLRAGVKPEDLKMAIDGIRALQIRGVSVTMPHKQKVMKYLDKIDKDAKRIGAVNTVVNNNGKLTGYNTDWTGALTALEQKTNVKNKKVAVIGAGGAARAIVYGLIKIGGKVKIFNRSKEKAQQLVKDFGCDFAPIDSMDEISKMDIIINATSVGMSDDKSIVDKKYLIKNQIIMDAVYSPRETGLIRNAKEMGAKIVYGYEMLLYQGVEQFKLYTGFDAPVEVMRKVLVENLK